MLVRLRDERGIAMVTALLVMMVLVSLSLAVIDLSNHNSVQSAYERHRDQSIQAAESGVGDFITTLAGTASASSICPTTNPSATLSTTPYVAYSVAVQVYDSSGNQITCSGYTGSPAPSYMLVTGTGTAGTANTDSAQSVRKFQVKLVLTPVTSPAFDKAVYGDTSISFAGNFNLYYNSTANDANIYSNGNVTELAGGSGADIEGTIYAQGNVGPGLKGCFEGDIWAKGYVDLGSSYTGACGDSHVQPGMSAGAGGFNFFNGYGNVTSSQSYVNESNAAWSYGVAKASGTVTCGADRCSPNRDTANATYPAHCAQMPNGGSQPSDNCGWPSQTGLPDPPTKPMPQYTYTASTWTGQGYVVATPTCASITAAYLSALTSKTVVVVPAGCNPSFGNNTVVTLQTSVAIILSGSFATVNQNTWSGTATNCSPTRCNLYIIRPYVSGLSCGSGTPGPNGISLSNNTDFHVNLTTFLYTQCDLTMANSADIYGQVYGGTDNITGNFHMYFTPANVPGGTATSSYQSQMVYEREVS